MLSGPELVLVEVSVGLTEPSLPEPVVPVNGAHFRDAFRSRYARVRVLRRKAPPLCQRPASTPYNDYARVRAHLAAKRLMGCRADVI